MNKRKGISLIVLVITILVMIILAGVVVVSLSKNNPIEKAKEAKYKNNFSTLKEALSLHVTNKLTEGIKKDDINYITEEELKNVFNGQETDFKGRLVVEKGELYVTNIQKYDHNVLNAGGSIILSTVGSKDFCIRLAYGATKKGDNIVLEPLEEVDDKGLKHHPHTFGPYMNLNKGTYTFIIEGENLDALSIDAYNNFNRDESSTTRYKINYIVKTPTKNVFTIDVKETTDNFELRFLNETYGKNPSTIKIKDKIIISGN